MLDGVDAGMDIAHDVEVFGPVFPIIVFDDFDEAMDLSLIHISLLVDIKKDFGRFRLDAAFETDSGSVMGLSLIHI